MKKLVLILFVFVSVTAFAQTGKQAADSVRITMYSGTNANRQTPLYVINDVISNDGIANINPQNIDRIDALKDSTATSIYGEAGKNGVVLIKTKTPFVRLYGSLTGKSYPLYVIDGMGYKTQPKWLNPKDVMGINVMQASDAIKAYGEKAHDGAIVIITKREKNN